MENEQVRGQEARLEFWQSMWFQLATFLFAGHDMNLVYAIHICYVLVVLPSVFFLRLFRADELLAEAIKWLQCNMIIVGVPNVLCNSPRRWIDSTWLADMGPITAWEDVMISAALTYRIFLYFGLRERQLRPQEKNLLRMCFVGLMGVTFFAVYSAVARGMVEIESLVVYFKTAALIALLFCAPHLYPGLSTRRSTSLFLFSVVLVFPLALNAVWLLMKYDIASNDTIIAKVDNYKYHLGAFYLMLHGWETLVSLLDRYFH